MAQWSSCRMSGLGPNSKLQQIQVPAVVSRIRRYNSLLSLSIPEHRTCLLINLHGSTAKSWWSGQRKNKTTVFRRAGQVLPVNDRSRNNLFSYCFLEPDVTIYKKYLLLRCFVLILLRFPNSLRFFHYYFIAIKHKILVNSSLWVVISTFIVYNSSSSAFTFLLQWIIYCAHRFLWGFVCKYSCW